MATTADSEQRVHWIAATLRAMAVAITGSACLLALLMLLVGSPVRQPLSPGQAAGVALIVAGVWLLLRWLIAGLKLGPRDRLIDAVQAGLSIGLLILAVALPAASTVITTYVVWWLLFGLVEAIWWFGLSRRSFAFDWPLASTLASGSAAEPAAVFDQALRRSRSSDESSSNLSETSTGGALPTVSDYPPRMQQRVTRTGDQESERIVVEFRECLAAGQKQAVLQAAFCPPMSTNPQVEVERTAGPEVQIKLTQADAFGVRCEIRRANAEEAAELLLRCDAEATLADDEDEAAGSAAMRD